LVNNFPQSHVIWSVLSFKKNHLWRFPSKSHVGLKVSSLEP
jgi:hypothetical protein